MLLFFCCSIEFYIGISIPTFVFSINTSAGSFRVSHGTLFPAVRDVSACSARTHNNSRFRNHVSQVNACAGTSSLGKSERPSSSGSVFRAGRTHLGFRRRFPNLAKHCTSRVFKVILLICLEGQLCPIGSLLHF